MRNKIVKEILKNVSPETKERLRKKFDRPFSPFMTILPDSWINWNKKEWDTEEYVQLSAGEAWNLDESSDEGYLAMKRMLHDLVNPQNENMSLDVFTQRLKELYESRKNN